jgi:excisionase family DNA binding protein
MERRRGMAQENWLTVSEIAARLKMTEQTVRRWLRSGKLRGRNFSGRMGYRVREDELQRFLEEEQPGEQAAA